MIEHRADRIFEPTVSVFDGGLVINYKKVGTRFIREFASGGSMEQDTKNKQIDFIIHLNPRFDIRYNNKIHYRWLTRHIYAPWHYSEHGFDNGHLADSFEKWKNDESFLADMGVESYTELFFENKKDIIFIIRNPLDRFFSGVTQCTLAYLTGLEASVSETEYLKEMTGFSDEKLQKMITLFTQGVHLRENSGYVPLVADEDMITLFRFILKYKWDLIISDIHAEPYLVHFREWINNIKDYSKVKVVDLAHLRTSTAELFFSKLANNEDGLYRKTINHQSKESNTWLYDAIKDAYNKNKFFEYSFGNPTSLIDEYLKHEYLTYLELLNSPFYINLAN